MKRTRTSNAWLHEHVTDPYVQRAKAEAMPREVMESVLRDRFAAWHGVSSILYLVQSVLGLLLAVIGARGVR